MNIENIQGITRIEYAIKSHNFCPIGQDWYTSNLKAVIEPDKQIPDYIELDNFVRNHIDKKEMIIEDAVATLFNHIQMQYKPKYLIVTNAVNDAKHSAVTVTKEGGCYE